MYVCGTTRGTTAENGAASAAVNGAASGTAAGTAAGNAPIESPGATSCASSRCTFVSSWVFVIGGGTNKPSGIGGVETATAGGVTTRGLLIVSGPGRPAGARGRTLEGRTPGTGGAMRARRRRGRGRGRAAGDAVLKYDASSTSFDAVDAGHSSPAAIGKPGSDRRSHIAASAMYGGNFGSGSAIGNGTAIGAAVTSTVNSGGVSIGGGGGTGGELGGELGGRFVPEYVGVHGAGPEPPR